MKVISKVLQNYLLITGRLTELLLEAICMFGDLYASKNIHSVPVLYKITFRGKQIATWLIGFSSSY